MEYGSFYFNFFLFLANIVRIVDMVMLGLSINYDSTETVSGTKVVQGNLTSALSVESRIDRLTKLKGLLDSVIISQEEFDAKKKQIL